MGDRDTFPATVPAHKKPEKQREYKVGNRILVNLHPAGLTAFSALPSR